MAAEKHDAKFSGYVEVYGVYLRGYVCTENREAHSVDRRQSEHCSGKRRLVVVMRERKGRKLPLVFRGKDEAVPTIRERMRTGTTVYADEASSRDALPARFNVPWVNHFFNSVVEDACTNQAEGYFVRLRHA